MSLKINGKRIREARIFNKMTMTELAENIGVTKQMISKYEHNQSNISLESLQKIIRTLNFPMNFFLETDRVIYENKGTFYRSRLTSTQAEKQPSETYKKLAAMLRDYFEDYIDFPELDMLDNDCLDNILPEQAAVELRNKWGLGSGPINSMVELMERHGIVVVNINLGSDKVDARSGYVKVDNKLYYIVLNIIDNTNFYREQFTLAHELGHYIMHANKVNPQDLSNDEYRAMENEANQFASAFLLPKDVFENCKVQRNYGNLLEYIPLKQKWNVSIAAIVMRAFELRVINLDQFKKLQKSISYRGWRKKEIGDEFKQITFPTLLHDAFRLLEEHSEVKARDLAYKLNEKYGYYYPNKLIAETLNIRLDEFRGETIPLAIKKK